MNHQQYERLERLGRLRATGVLSDEEFATAKAAILEGKPDELPARFGGYQDSRPAPASDAAPELSRTWQARFAFFDAHGTSNTPGQRAAFRALPLRERMALNFSGWAFFLGPIYFAVLGLWKPALSLLAGSIVYSVILSTVIQLPESIDRVAWVGPAALYATTCPALYYFKVSRGIHSWNPFVYLRRQQ